MPDTPPSTHGPNGGGRGANGRFTAGNKLGRGNPLAGEAAKIRALLFKRAKRADREAIVDRLINLAKSGDLAAIREYLDRTVGKPVPSDVLERLEAIERALAERLQTPRSGK